MGGRGRAPGSTSLAGVAAGLGTMRGRSLLAGASTPAYLTVWNRGGGTEAGNEKVIAFPSLPCQHHAALGARGSSREGGVMRTPKGIGIYLHRYPRLGRRGGVR